LLSVAVQRSTTKKFPKKTARRRNNPGGINDRF
jgi:hypothetical protein